MDVQEYISKVNHQLKDKNFDKKVHEDPTRRRNDIVNNIIDSFKKQELLFTSTAKKSTTNEVRTPEFHILPRKCINQIFQEDQL